MEEQGGGPQEMAFVRAMAGRFPALTPGLAGPGQAAPQEASLGATSPTLDISGQVHRVPRVVSMELEALPQPRGPRVFPWLTLPTPSPTPQRKTAREELGTWGQDGVLATVPRQVEWARAGGTQAHGCVLLWGLRPVPRLGG